MFALIDIFLEPTSVSDNVAGLFPIMLPVNVDAYVSLMIFVCSSRSRPSEPTLKPQKLVLKLHNILAQLYHAENSGKPCRMPNGMECRQFPSEWNG